jgi:predicted DNA repair protein MutK
MFLVGGGILVHGVPLLHHLVEGWAHAAGAMPGVGAVMEIAVEMLANAAVGIAAGAVVLAAVFALQRLRRPRTA